MGKRRMGELEADELVSSLLISEIGAMPISDSSIPLISAIIPIVFICALEVLLSALKNKWRGAKRILEGEPTYIIYKGRILTDALEENRLSINEILAEMRSQGIGNIDNVYYAILEPNGKLSLLERDGERQMGHAVIIDGEVRTRELDAVGRNRTWLECELTSRGASVSDTLLLSVTEDGDVKFIRKEVNG